MKLQTASGDMVIGSIAEGSVDVKSASGDVRVGVKQGSQPPRRCPLAQRRHDVGGRARRRRDGHRRAAGRGEGHDDERRHQDRPRVRIVPELLRDNRQFRTFFAGQAISLVGDQISLIALPLVAVLALDATPARWATCVTAALLPNLLFSLHAGAWVDRAGRRRQVMIAADLGRAAALASVPIAYAFGALTFAQLYAVGFRHGLAERVLLRLLHHAVRRARAARAVRRRELAAARQPGTLGRRRPEPRRCARAAADRAGRPGSRRPLVRRLRRVARAGSGRRSLRRAGGAAGTSRPGCATSPAPGRSVPRSPRPRRSTSSTSSSSRWSSSTRIATSGSDRARSGSCSGSARSAAVIGVLITGRVSAADRSRARPTSSAASLFPAPLVLVPLAGGPALARAHVPLPRRVRLRARRDDARHRRAARSRRRSSPIGCGSRVTGAYMVVNYGVRPIGAFLGGVLGSAIGVQTTLWIAVVGGLLGFLFLLPLADPADARAAGDRGVGRAGCRQPARSSRSREARPVQTLALSHEGAALHRGGRARAAWRGVLRRRRGRARRRPLPRLRALAGSPPDARPRPSGALPAARLRQCTCRPARRAAAAGRPVPRRRLGADVGRVVLRGRGRGGARGDRAPATSTR